MSEPKTAEPATEDAASPGLAAAASDVDGLRLQGDVKGLLELAKEHRAKREMKRCFAAYSAAAELGSAEAEYAVALFWMSGGVVEQDLKEGAMRLRGAAEKGSLPAKVYLGNLYELGIFYKADPEKADVWYRNAARSGNVQSEAGTPEHARELAELGCVRYVLQVVGTDVPEEEKARLLQKARAHGHGLRLKDAASTDVAASVAPEDTRPAEAAQAAKAHPDAAVPEKAAGPSRAALAVGAFGYALLFATAGLAAAYVAMLGARELVARGTALPGLGTRSELVFPIVLGAVGVLPTWLVYRFGAVLKALVAGAFLGGVGWVAWGTGQATIHAYRPAQTIAFGLAGFLAALFVIGFLGGTKRQAGRRGRRAS